MEKRINVFAKGQQPLKPLFDLNVHFRESSLGKGLIELVNFRVSQINACPYCLDMHYKEARAAGESEQKLYGLNAWRETGYYSARERAALAWAEALTASTSPGDAYQEVVAEFSLEEFIDLSLVISAMNTWNRINIAFPLTAGSY